MQNSEANLSEQEYFDKYVNISYVDPELPVPDNKIIIKHYLCSVLIYGICIILFWLNPWFAELMSANIYGVSVKKFLTYAYCAYLVIAPIVYFSFKPKSIWISHNIIIFEYVKRILKQQNKLQALTVNDICSQLALYKPNYKESQSILVLLIKLFFGCQMLSYSFNNFSVMLEQVPLLLKYIKAAIFYIQNFGTDMYMIYSQVRWQLYITLINILFWVDLSCYSVGYFTELNLFKNRIRSVDNTPAGILFCIACYQPFLNASNTYLSSFHNRNDLMVFGNPEHWLTWFFHSFILIFTVIFVAASIALFTKASNLTNRGIVSKWPYSVVRHPAYTAKIISWWFMVLPLFFVNFHANDFNIYKYLLESIIIVLSIFAWMVIYYFRALTEERHLMQDPDYREYVRKVKYRFIPGLW